MQQTRKTSLYVGKIDTMEWKYIKNILERYSQYRGIYLYIYIYIERERERKKERETDRQTDRDIYRKDKR